MTVGDGAAGLEEVGFEELANEIELDDAVGNAELLTVKDGKGNLFVVVLGAIVEAETADDMVVRISVIEG